MPGALENLADTYENELQIGLRVMTNLIEPAMIIMMALMVGFLLLSVLSAMFAGVGGGLLSLSSGFATPSIAGFLHSVELVTMVVLGGMGSIFGSVVGAAILVLLPQLLVVFQEYENLMLGLIMVVVMVFLRRGIVPSIAELLAGRRA